MSATMVDVGASSPSSNDDEYDAFSSMLSRGALLRKLRELEREDEAEREQEDAMMSTMQEKNDDATLRYENFLAHQAYYDDYKHVNYKYVDFGVVGNDRLVIEQDRTVGKGGFVWDAGYILGEHVLRQHNEFQQPCSVIELGAGTGITGLVIAQSRPDTAKVHLTDLAALQPLLEKNSKEIPNATFGELEWGVTGINNQKYDVILGADVVASIYCAEALAKTIDELAKPDSRVYLACRDRLAGTIDQFESYMRQIFSHVERTKAESFNKNPDVWVFSASGKRSGQ
jgi:predicted nicotinamide N-methyase